MSALDFGARALARQAAMLAARPAPTIAGLGDSITNQNSYVDATNIDFNAKGDIVWARALLGGRIGFSPALNFGISGQNSTQILARVGGVIAARPGYCRVLAGTNDPVTGTTYAPAATWANLKAIYDALTAAAIVVIACPILPRAYGLSNGTGTPAELVNAQKGFLWVNRMIRRYALSARPGTIYVADYDRALLDQGSTAYAPLALVTSEGLHPIAAGAYWLGKALAAVLDPLLPPLAMGIVGQQNVYDAAYNPLGNRLPFGQLAGTAGTPGAGVTGQAADGWSIARTAGATATAVASKETVDARTGEVRQVITLGGAAGGATTEMIAMSRNLAPGAASYAAGDLLVGEIEIEAAGLAQVRNIALRISDTGTSTLKYYGLNSSGNTADRLPSLLPKLLVQTPSFTAAAGSTMLTIALEITLDASSVPAGAVKIGHATLRTADG